MDIKSGWKTTEFWISLGTLACGGLLLFGVISAEQQSALVDAVGKIAGAVISVLAAFGYSLSRGIAKSGGD